MVIVWRLRGNIIRTVLYIANVLPLQWAQLTKTVHTAQSVVQWCFLLPPHYCGLGAGSIPLGTIVNGRRCETRGLFMSLIVHY